MANQLSSLILERIKVPAPDSGNLRLLWIADENFDLGPAELVKLLPFTTFITNRYDIAETIRKCGNAVFFSDFNTAVVNEKFDLIVYRVSKERHVSHHCLNAASELLKEQGQLILCGKKQEGVKTYFEKVVKVLGFQGGLEKRGDWYLAGLVAGKAGDNKLDDGDYRRMRFIADSFGYQLFSKPGVYGWKSIDAGSALLADCIQQSLPRQDLSSSHVLDLGCGSGYLTLLAASMGFGEMVATDNNAAAIEVSRYNCATNNITATVLADDCGNGINKRFEYILCNPPFHQGFGTSSNLTSQFASAAHRLLVPGGSAYFVVNAFIPLEAVSASLFNKIELLENNKKFKVMRLEK